MSVTNCTVVKQIHAGENEVGVGGWAGAYEY